MITSKYIAHFLYYVLLGALGSHYFPKAFIQDSSSGMAIFIIISCIFLISLYYDFP